MHTKFWIGERPRAKTGKWIERKYDLKVRDAGLKTVTVLRDSSPAHMKRNWPYHYQNFVRISYFRIRTTFSAHHSLLDFTILTALDGLYNTRSSLSCIVLHFHIFLNRVFSWALCCQGNCVRRAKFGDAFHNRTKQMAKNWFKILNFGASKTCTGLQYSFSKTTGLRRVIGATAHRVNRKCIQNFCLKNITELYFFCRMIF